MSASGLLFAAVAMLPAMTLPAEGALHSATGGALAVALCNGGSIAIPLAGGSAPPFTPPCCAGKGCRTGDKRSLRASRIDRKQ